MTHSFAEWFAARSARNATEGVPYNDLMQWRSCLLSGGGLVLDLLPDDETDAAHHHQERQPEHAVANGCQQFLQAGKSGDQREQERCHGAGQGCNGETSL